MGGQFSTWHKGKSFQMVIVDSPPWPAGSKCFHLYAMLLPREPGTVPSWRKDQKQRSEMLHIRKWEDAQQKTWKSLYHADLQNCFSARRELAQRIAWSGERRGTRTVRNSIGRKTLEARGSQGLQRELSQHQDGQEPPLSSVQIQWHFPVPRDSLPSAFSLCFCMACVGN